MKAVILAGGLGARLRPFTEIIPKPLLPIGEKAIMEIQIEHLKEVKAQKPEAHILSISVDLADTQELLSQYKSDHGMDWVVGRDTTRKGSEKFQVVSIPTMAYIDELGIVRHWEVGETPASTIIGWINS